MGLFFIPQMTFMSMDSHDRMIQEKTEELGEKPLPVTLYPSQILCGPTRVPVVRGQYQIA
jgi:hypothetical protein